MATVYISEFAEFPVWQGSQTPAAPMPPVAEQTVAIGGGSVASAAFNAKTRIVGIHTDAICSIAFGAAPTATATNRRLAANATEYFRVQPGHKVAVITNT